jgi:chromosomal replication initiation ATPase DnaA
VDIGRVFGGRDHSTVIYACEKIAAMVAADEEFAERINGFISTLAAG